MDMYGLTAPDHFRIDDLLDFSNDDLFISSASTTTNVSAETSDDIHHHYLNHENSSLSFYPSISTDFTTDDLCVPTGDAAELEWLSQFVDDSFSHFPLTGTLPVRSDTAFSGRVRSNSTYSPAAGKSRQKNEAATEEVVRRCTHCASEKTPQWRTGPLGPKTLCNACGVRYKSGRLVPEYRPAASPTFELTQHSNSHRKVMELRRQKEKTREQE
ncbi:GATA transcription factor 4 [Tripterygium wilfordii]|uniref:GATA transcription factor 4 n=1 Tax=Tripterygium wilfordii TaxID=458696 RepID=A0A7J7CBX3_TRIWF|nr:GATA transcription factor 4-like [Tripterygium wilfordii]KAF5731633.1 GATA transcription factor 4 [Tripterygium wilfordii]